MLYQRVEDMIFKSKDGINGIWFPLYPGEGDERKIHLEEFNKWLIDNKLTLDDIH